MRMEVATPTACALFSRLPFVTASEAEDSHLESLEELLLRFRGSGNRSR
jgi:hypothetical protein